MTGTLQATVTTVPFKLHLSSLEKKFVPTYTHLLLKILFFSKSNSFFVSYTETPDEISLILDDNIRKLFPNGGDFKFSEKVWRAIQFSIGASPADTKGFISTIAAPLSRAGISIYYFYTFNTDYILVEESSFQAAKECIKENFSVVGLDEDDEQSLILSATQQIQSKPTNVLESFTQLQALTDLPLVPTSISLDSLPEITKDMIELIFFSSSSSRFFSFTQTGDEISLLIDTATLANFGGKLKLEVVLDETWIPIKRVKKHGFTEIGVVSALSAPLKEISILYLSTFASANVMVRKEDFPLAISKLQAAGFLISNTKIPK